MSKKFLTCIQLLLYFFSYLSLAEAESKLEDEVKSIDYMNGKLFNFPYEKGKYINSFSIDFSNIKLEKSISVKGKKVNVITEDDNNNNNSNSNLNTNSSTNSNTSTKDTLKSNEETSNSKKSHSKKNISKSIKSGEYESKNSNTSPKKLSSSTNHKQTEQDKMNYYIPNIINDLELIRTDHIPQSFNIQKHGQLFDYSFIKDNFLEGIKKKEDLNYFEAEILEHVEKENHGIKNYKLNLNNGMKMTCGLPFKKKISNSMNSAFSYPESITTITEKLGELLMYKIGYVCHNTNIDEWFYKICPFSSAHQQLTYMMKHSNGTSYLPYFSLGNKQAYIQEQEEKIKEKLNNDLKLEENMQKEDSSTEVKLDNKKEDPEISQTQNNDGTIETIIINKDYKIDLETDIELINEYYKAQKESDRRQPKKKENKKSQNEKYSGSLDLNILEEDVETAKQFYTSYNNNKIREAEAKKISLEGLVEKFKPEIIKLAEEENIDLYPNELAEKPYLVCEERVCRVYNYDFTHLKKNESELFLNYTAKEMKQFLNNEEQIFVLNEKLTSQKVYFIEYMTKLGLYYLIDKYFNVDESTIEKSLLTQYENVVITIHRKIIKVIGDNIIIINKEMPGASFVTNEFKLKVSENKISNIEVGSYLSVSRTLVYCVKCEFLMNYQVGDYLVLKNDKFHASNMSKSMKGANTYQVRRIKRLVSNQLLIVDQEFDINFQGILQPNAYIVISFSESLKALEQEGYFLHVRGAKGVITETYDLVKGKKTKFTEDVRNDDFIYIINSSAFINSPSTSLGNPRYNIDLYQLCQIKNVFNDKLLSTHEKCLFDKKRAGAFILITLVKDNTKEILDTLNLQDETKLIPEVSSDYIYSPIDYYTFPEIVISHKMKNFYLYTNIVDKRMNEYNEFAFNKNRKIRNNKVTNFTSSNFFPDENSNTNLFSELSNDSIVNNDNFNSEDNNDKLTRKTSNNLFFNHESLFFPNNLNSNFNLSFKLKNHENSYSILSLIITLHNDENDKSKNSFEKYQLLIDSKYGIILKRLNNENTKSTIIDHYITHLRNLYIEATTIQIIHVNKAFYLLTTDHDNKSSIKIAASLPNKISKIEIDIDNSSTIQINNIFKRNFITVNDLFYINEFKLKASLDDKASFIEYFSKGDVCEPTGQPRKTIVEYRCDTTDMHEAHIDDVKEEELCVYRLFVRSRYLCNVLKVKERIYLKSSVKTECSVTS